jgi:hypothetical protein
MDNWEYLCYKTTNIHFFNPLFHCCKDDDNFAVVNTLKQLLVKYQQMHYYVLCLF